MKIILLTILSFLSLWGLSFDELIYKNEVRASFDCSKVKNNGKNDDELIICNKIGAINEFENKKLALMDNIFISLYQELLKNANENIKEDFKLVVKKMFRERKNCAKVISNDLLQVDQDPQLPFVYKTDCIEKTYAKVFLELMQKAKKDTQSKERLKQIFNNQADRYENLIQMSIQDPIDLEIFIDNLAQEGLIDDNARLKL
ncbi:hypothetical protein CUJ61_07760 [Campylobacter coli]|uniref:hypothetical protein n=1 Tax=Campylobacter coli TaxID=195 RepID=UPI000FA20413|nr:hypothetical protein [Campylobacter coli]EAH4948671.1 hypothetical protein [Campylobacter coli]EAH5659309.1 hypothetical protein [Campylobacter coli]EAH6015680.1 hypothetical protein [Campylobacter coli]EAH9613569.1 hypothetical protein [Campylobacter coli]EAI0965351.1 hypothetical protein [Campylobacter coli]